MLWFCGVQICTSLLCFVFLTCRYQLVRFLVLLLGLLELLDIYIDRHRLYEVLGESGWHSITRAFESKEAMAETGRCRCGSRI